MGPKKAYQRAMGVPVLVGISMMDAMGGHPGNRPPLTGKGAAKRKEIFQKTGDFKAAVGQKPVIAKRDAEAAGHKMKKKAEKKGFPAKGKEAGQGYNMNAYYK